MQKVLNVAPQPKSSVQAIWEQLRELFTYRVLYANNNIRFLRHKGVRIGEGCQILTGLKAFGTEPWLIELGNRVTITAGVTFLTHDGASRLFRDSIPNGSRYGNRFGRIIIHDESFIGVNVIIMPGVEIGPCSIVGAGSVVNKDVPSNMVYAGVPAKPICTLDEYIQNYCEKMIPIKASNRVDLRSELTHYFWGEER